MLMWENDTWFAVLVTWSSVVIDLQVGTLFVLINLEEEVLLCHYFLISFSGKILFAHLILELN